MAKIRLVEPEPPVKKPRTKAPPPQPTLFEQLLPCTWRGIFFPVSSMKVSFSQDVVEHKYWGVDAADVESTGRAPMQIEATIPFVNGIVPGKGEKWGVLYPTEFRKFVQAFADRTTGDLQHPELGFITCKAVSIDFSHDAQTRDGVMVTARWVETIAEQSKDFDPDHTPIQAADIAALDLDASSADILGLAPEAAFPEESFESLVNKATGFVDSITTTATLLANKPAQVRYRIQTFQDSVERLKNVLTWGATESCERIKSAMHDLDAAFSSKVTVTHSGGSTPPAPPGTTPGKKIARFKTPARMNLAGILAHVSATTTFDELVSLNPILVSRIEVAEGTVIRYYG